MSVSPGRGSRPSPSSGRLPDLVILLGVAGCVGYMAFGVSRIGFLHPPIWQVLVVGLPAALAVALLLALRLPRPTRAKIALALGSSCASLFAADLFFQSWDSHPARAARAARAAGRPVDSRTARQVVRDLREQGQDAMPFTPLLMNGTLTFTGPDNSEFPVLGGVSRVTTTLCNESGQFPIYDADEHGFNNPPRLHGRSPLQIVLIGDSFTHGACVAQEDSIAGRLRRVFPDTLNLGIGGSAPLSQFARFVEYGAPGRPRFVVWVWYDGNDLGDLHWELSRAPLRRYLTTSTALGLRDRQADIDDAIRTAYEGRRPIRSRWLRRLRSMLAVRSLRLRVAEAGLPVPRNRGLHDDLAVLERILAGVRDSARGWGGELVMVFLPQNHPHLPSPPRDLLFGVFERLGLPVVDTRAAFADTGRPLETFLYYPGSHFTPAGYRLVADAVLLELQTRLAASAAAPSQR